MKEEEDAAADADASDDNNKEEEVVVVVEEGCADTTVAPLQEPKLVITEVLPSSDVRCRFIAGCMCESPTSSSAGGRPITLL